MWFYYGLFAGLLGAITVLLSKKALKDVSAVSVSFALFSFNLPLYLLVLFFTGWPKTNIIFLISAIFSSLFFVVTAISRLEIFKNNSLSSIFPLTSFNTFFTYLLGLVFLNEIIKPTSLLGILLIFIGVYILNFSRNEKDLFKPFKILIANKNARIYLVSMFFVAVASIFDKTALVNSTPNSPALTLFVENIFLCLFIYLYAKKKKIHFVNDIKKKALLLFICSALYAGLGLFVFYGFLEAPVALVSAIKKFEILFVLLLSWIFFQDKPTKNIWTGALLMIFGAILIKI